MVCWLVPYAFYPNRDGYHVWTGRLFKLVSDRETADRNRYPMLVLLAQLIRGIPMELLLKWSQFMPTFAGIYFETPVAYKWTN